MGECCMQVTACNIVRTPDDVMISLQGPTVELPWKKVSNPVPLLPSPPPHPYRRLRSQCSGNKGAGFPRMMPRLEEVPGALGGRETRAFMSVAFHRNTIPP